ncbi:MAG: Na(+)-translocating NADH-quinone reductase subunit A [Gammaproteobacteria bacterium]|nr:Na(+)-translocating NADH-quinone reductase subunit A [Gammaproteobacteria bacterium]
MRIKQGLDVPIAGAPDQSIQEGNSVTRVALLGDDYLGMKPTMLVAVGDSVKLGQPLFSCKKTEGVVYTSPAAGKVLEINRGDRRKLLSVVIEVEGDDAVQLETIEASKIPSASREEIQSKLVGSGLWTALRTRPFNKVPALEASASAIFVNAMDTRPLAANPQVLIGDQPEAFANGCAALARLTEGKLHIVSAPGANLPDVAATNVEHSSFEGPHPAGLVGTHIHHLHPVSAERVVWTIDAADVIAIGNTLTSGKLDVSRVVALAGPCISKPRLVRSRLGADLMALTANETTQDNVRVVSGSVLDGTIATGNVAYLGRYHNQVSVLQEGEQRTMLHWLKPWWPKFSNLRVFTSAKNRAQTFAMTTSRNGSPRSMVPIGSYESVMPLDILATPLLRALLIRDTDTAQKMGALELAEEDLALCSFVCHSKYEFGASLRESLSLIEKDG